MVWFRHGHGNVSASAAWSRSSLRVVLVALVALTSMAMGATSSLASASGRAATNCRFVVCGAPWKVATRSESNYALAARGVPCALARPWAMKLTHQTDRASGPFKGPAGFTCRSFSTSASGDKLLYAGVCSKGPHNLPFFGWGPKV